MRLWRFADPRDYRFAQASRHGAWSKGSLCPECTASSEERVPPLILEWEFGSDVVGDFTWPGFSRDIAVTDRAKEQLRGFGGFKLGPVEMAGGLVSKSRGSARGAKLRGAVPYRGPRLHELWVTARAKLDGGRSSVQMVKDCGTCGKRRYEAVGIETHQVSWDPLRRKSTTVRVPRMPGKGLFISERDLGGMDIFCAVECPSWVLCTDRVKDVIEQSGLTNVGFMEMGETVS